MFRIKHMNVGSPLYMFQDQRSTTGARRSRLLLEVNLATWPFFNQFQYLIPQNFQNEIWMWVPITFFRIGGQTLQIRGRGNFSKFAISLQISKFITAICYRGIYCDLVNFLPPILKHVEGKLEPIFIFHS